MKNRLIRILVCTLLITTAVLPVVAIVNNNENITENWGSIRSEPQYRTTSQNDIDWWSKLHHDQNNTGYSSSTYAPQTNNIKWTFKTDDWVDSSPAVVNGKVYIASFDENLYCLDAETGEYLWNYYMPGLGACSPAVYDDKVYIDSAFDYFYCVDANTGDLIWTFYKGYRFSRPAPVVVDGKVYFAHSRSGNLPESNENASLYCLDADTGEKIWESQDLGWFDLSSPAMYNDRIYIGSEDHNFYCFDANTGEILWTYQTYGKVLSSPTISDERIYFCSGHDVGILYCLNALTGDLIWYYHIGVTYCSPALGYGNVYVGNEYGNTFFCLNASTGELLWDYTINGGFSFSSPAIADGKVYASTYYTRYLLCLDAFSGEFYWSYKLSNNLVLTSSPAIVNGSLYIGGGISGKVYCFEDPARPPDAPTINGPMECIPFYEYDFEFSSIDPENRSIRYYVDWGDGTSTGWIGPYPSGQMITIKHSWSGVGLYVIKAIAKDNDGMQSEWSEHNITVIGPMLEIQRIKSGVFKISAVIKNIGTQDASDVNWSITLDGGFILFGRKTTGNLDNIHSGGDISIASDLVLGFGSINITVDVSTPEGFSDTRVQKGYAFLFFIKVYPSG